MKIKSIIDKRCNGSNYFISVCSKYLEDIPDLKELLFYYRLDTLTHSPLVEEYSCTQPAQYYIPYDLIHAEFQASRTTVWSYTKKLMKKRLLHYDIQRYILFKDISFDCGTGDSYITLYRFLMADLAPELAFFMSYLISMESYCKHYDENTHSFQLSDSLILKNPFFSDFQNKIGPYLKKLKAAGYIKVAHNGLNQRYIQIQPEKINNSITNWKNSENSHYWALRQEDFDEHREFPKIIHNKLING